MNRVRYYFLHSSIHGLHYIIEPNRHWTERIFWIVMCTGAVLGLIQLFQLMWYTFQHNAVSFTVETTYLGWETTFPAVSVCEHDSPDKIYELGNKLFGGERNMNLDFYVRDIAFFDGTCYSCKAHCNKSITCMKNMTLLVQQFRAPCNELINNCEWNGVPFDCCNNFLALNTEMGTCFSINSLHTKSSCELLKSNHLTGPGRLTFKTYEAVKILLHAPEDVPYINHPQEEKEVLNWGHFFNISFQVKEIENDPVLQNEILIEKRNCRFPEENLLQSYSLYSYSACVVDCRTKAQLQFCGCVHHFTPTLIGAKTCDIQGLICLTNYSEQLRVLRSPDSTKEGIICDCMSSCLEPEYTVISKVKSQNDNYDDPDYGSHILVQMDSLPNERFKRNVVRTRLDLIVSMGGAAGLFLGASLFSTFEFVYYLFVRRSRNKDNKNRRRKFNTNNRKISVTTRPEILQHKIRIVTQYQNKINQSNINPRVAQIPYLE